MDQLITTSTKKELKKDVASHSRLFYTILHLYSNDRLKPST